jgi:hypothetical protein
MKLPIDTSGMTFMAAARARPVTDFETRQHKADENGELLYNLQVVALDPDGAQVIAVKVPGDPGVGQGAMIVWGGKGAGEKVGIKLVGAHALNDPPDRVRRAGACGLDRAAVLRRLEAAERERCDGREGSGE